MNKALGLNINQDDLQKLQESEYNNNVSLNALNALEAWKAGYTGKGMKVGIFDSDSGFDSDALIHEFSNVKLFSPNPSLLENVDSLESETVSLIGKTVSLLRNSHNVPIEIANILYDSDVKKLLQHQVNVVYGITPEESDQIIEDLISSGKFMESSLFNFITDSAVVEAEIDSGNLGSFGDSSWVLYQDFNM